MLLIGPTGAGKSFLARRIYELKRSRYQMQGRFVEVNCATLRGDGAMSTLFGHIKGGLNRLLGENVEMDLFDRLQLKAVLDVCRQADSLSDAGRRLFGVSRQAKAQPNDADRLRKYLARFALDWKQVSG